MGWGAAMALAEEWSDWCDGPEEAYDILYGGRDNPKPVTKQKRCPICNKKCKSPVGVSIHMDAVHRKRKFDDVKAAFRAEHGLSGKEASQ